MGFIYKKMNCVRIALKNNTFHKWPYKGRDSAAKQSLFCRLSLSMLDAGKTVVDGAENVPDNWAK